ncbi:MAG: Ldh family oxidoreductase [Chloroflexi bacterium]|nr:Ldh family oxidoreductase [Chloroflexota bacterium]MCH7655440.1 Ldh family oxidoreductase [Chloroflexota bacterium]
MVESFTESFKVPERDAVRVDADALRAAAAGLIEKMGVPPADAELAADVLVSADLRGVESHGVSNMLKVYLDRYADGTTNPRPEWTVVRDRPAIANIDCDRGLGVILAPKAMDIAIAKARETGVGVVTMFNCGHLGMASYHAMRALAHDMVGMCMTATGPSVLPTFGAEPRLGTNPIAIAAPALHRPPFVLDMATSTVAVNKLRNAKRLGSLLPPGTVADAQGTPIMEAVPVPDDYFGLPLGSTRELGSHKGYGLAAAVEVLCSVLSGAGFATRLPRTHYRHYVAAYDVSAFTDATEFKQTMDDFIGELTATPPAPGQERVMVAGQPEWEAEAEHRAHGIPLHREVVDWLRSTCAEMGVACGV